MHEPVDQAAALVDELAAHTAERVGPGGTYEAEFVRRYWSRAAAEDLVEREPADLVAAALRHLHMARRREPHQPLIRVYTPTIEDDAWHCVHSIVDCVVDDMPFIVDSLTMQLDAAGIGIHLIVHPVIPIDRAGDGELRSVSPDAPRESFVHIEIDRLRNDDAAESLRRTLLHTLDEVRQVVDDWAPMRQRALDLAAELDAEAGSSDPAIGDHSETADLLRWLTDDHFTFLSYREYELVGDPPSDEILSIPESGLGLQRDAPPSRHQLRDLLPDAATVVRSDALLNITKTNAYSPVHRHEPMDYIGVKRRSPATGRLTERRFLGLYTHRAYRETVGRIPIIRRKVDAVIERAAFEPHSHDANRLIAILDSYPRDDLFQMSEDELYTTVLGILRLRERHTVRLFARTDTFGRYASCLVYVPRDRFNTAVRMRIIDLLTEAFGGTHSTFTTEFSADAHARLRVVVHRPAGAAVPDELDVLEDRIERVTRDWGDELRRALVESLGDVRGLELFDRWQRAFPVAYEDEVPPSTAVADIERIEELGADGMDVSLRESVERSAGQAIFRIYRTGGPVSLSAVLPILKNLGADVLDEQPYDLTPGTGVPAFIYDFGVVLPHGTVDEPADRRRVEDAFLAIWHGQAENDGLGPLVVLAGLGWRDVALLRAYRQYLRQTNNPFSEPYYDETLRRHPDAARLLVARFAARFDPDAHSDATEAALRNEYLELVSRVDSLDDDRILRAFGEMIDATVRTNFYSRDADGRPLDRIALKLDPEAVSNLPSPLPRHEVFVYSPTTEGVHLRMGPIARGGLRASDRREDYRTEILGLVKAQTVKNAVIVPVGAKGGFVNRRVPTGDRDRDRAEVLSSYRTFVSGLLDVTDNLVDGAAVTPPRVVRHDGDDAYLVVAADKGTATFSDVANEIAVSRGFWLGDAFASGGSNGYDHKAMGITARGAWESVRRHFRQLGIDADTDPITVVGIGDMSGDVFGNGMLLARNLRLVAAFDHRHVFVDPTPPGKEAWAERQRLFGLPQSTWDDYDKSLISAGGGVFSRKAKSVPITPEMRAALAIDAEALTPDELISAVLRAPVDLLFNGGIGTYVKASTESHADAADRANDHVRVDASQLRCRVIGEGGNLGMTQRARIEFARAGGLVNTDAIDNSGGVDCSDHEVNLKIALDAVVAAGDLTTKQRNELLFEATDEVAALVLRDNYDQNVALAAARAQAPGMTDVHARHLAWLERVADLDRRLEALPSDDELVARRSLGEGLTQPELAVLLAYTKLHLTEELLTAELDDPESDAAFVAYFPEQIRERFRAQLEKHPLRREITATQISNRLVNRAGISMAHRLQEESSASIADIARAHTVAWRVFDLDQLWDAINERDGQMPNTAWIAALLDVKRHGERATRWFIRNRRSPLDVVALVDEFRQPLSELADHLSDVVPQSLRRDVAANVRTHVDGGLGHDLAEALASLPLLISALDIVDIARETGASPQTVAQVHFAIEDALGLGWLRHQITELPRGDRWQSLARSALRDDFFVEHRALTTSILADTATESAGAHRTHAWAERNRNLLTRFTALLSELGDSSNVGLAQLSVALRELRNLTHRAERATRADR